MLRAFGLGLTLFAFWLALSGHYTPLLLTLGVGSCVLVVYLAHRMEAIDEEGGVWVYRKDWGGDVDFSDLEQDDILLFRLYVTPLGGGYSAPKGRAPNHGGVYLGNGYMLHHPYNGLSDIDDLYDPAFHIYQTACVGAIRGSDI